MRRYALARSWTFFSILHLTHSSSFFPIALGVGLIIHRSDVFLQPLFRPSDQQKFFHEVLRAMQASDREGYGMFERAPPQLLSCSPQR